MASLDNQKDSAHTNNLFMTAEELREYADKIDTARASAAFKDMRTAEDARKLVMEKMSKRIEVTDQMRSNLLSRIKAAAVEGKTELMVLQFPVELCTDQGRAINNNEPEWPDTLTGVPRQAYEVWRDKLKPAEYRLTAMIVEWPHGMPGDVGLFLGWGKPKAL
ncbi:hypothetical protein OIU34_36190 [Pararhizobium sp. BT-229]|uniref:hypothetical protein n=1 Tax=Pararhizobium sp. BT-229 TaxID=2986923 RepID=UPI0021F71D8C|nr:hypothetical protein [Pararhizobium sp. BT-229]MCV9967278.1 hypothetical protein [Pararhizobium sp. BT-229]